MPTWESTASRGAVPAPGRLVAAGATPADLALFQATTLCEQALQDTLLRRLEVDLAPYFFLPQPAILHTLRPTPVRLARPPTDAREEILGLKIGACRLVLGSASVVLLLHLNLKCREVVFYICHGLLECPNNSC